MNSKNPSHTADLGDEQTASVQGAVLSLLTLMHSTTARFFIILEDLRLRRPFHAHRRNALPGETIMDILAAVVKTEPDLSRVPPKIRRLLHRCLEKDPGKRLRDIGD